MEDPSKIKSFFIKLSSRYNVAALILLNTLIGILILNCLFFLFFRISSKFTPNVIANKYDKVNLNLLYPHMSSREIDDLLKETWSRAYVYEPFTQFKERPYKGHYVNIDKDGFRDSSNQGPWPPQSKSINVFLFGGSTTFGYGVSDNETIASYLQDYLTQKLDTDVRVYNFGRGSYYSTQERLLFEQLLTSGFVPDLAIFMDGLNDFAYYENKPLFTDQLRQLFATGSLEMSKKLLSMTSLGQAAGLVSERIDSLFRKAGIKQLNGPEKKDIENEIINKVIHTYIINKKLIEAASNIFGVKSIFVWQPNPAYNYDLKYHPFFNGDAGEINYSKNGYLGMANFIRENPMGDNFIWCADIQKELKQPLYVDRVHYSADFSKLLAEVIANTLVEKFNIKKRPDLVRADKNEIHSVNFMAFFN
jgi:GDSL-like Lipase/Acylhydrolase family